MVTRKMEYNFEQIKCYFNAKISDQEEKLTKVSNNVLNERVCHQIYSERTKTKKSSDYVLDTVKSLFKEAKVDIAESVIDRDTALFVNLPVSLFPVLFFVTWPVTKFF